MKELAIGWVNIKRMLRERSNIFFVFIFPIALVLLIGVQFGAGFEPVIGVSRADDSALAAQMTAQIDNGTTVEEFDSAEALTTATERGLVQVGVLFGEGMDELAASGQTVEVGLISRPDGSGAQLQSIILAAVSEVMGPIGAAQFASVETRQPFDDTLAAASALAGHTSEIAVQVSTVGEEIFPASMGQFDLGASSQLVLFTFLTALAGSYALILTRQLGISKRMLSTPTSVRQIVIGESLGRFGTAIFQGIYIMLATLVIFQVNWGDPLGALLLVVALSAVGAGAGMLMGATFSNDQQASGIGVMLALGLAALGGAMVPLDLFSPTMQQIAHLTPHAWALDGFAELVRRDGTTIDILPELGVLAAYAVALLSLAAWRLRIAITRP